MGSDEKKIARTITEAVSILPAAKRDYILGYAEGIIAMANRQRTEQAQGSV